MFRLIATTLGIVFIWCNISAHAYGDLRPFLESFKDVMKQGNESLGIPVYDPFVSDEETLHVDISYVLVDLLLNDLRMTGLSEYQVKKGSYTKVGLHMELGLRWEKIVTKTDYDINGTLLGDDPIYGKGHLVGVIEGLDVTSKLDIAVGGNGVMRVTNIVSTVKLESLDLKISGLYNDEHRSKILSTIISRQAPRMIAKHPIQAGQIMSDLTEQTANQILAHLTVKDLFDLIKEKTY